LKNQYFNNENITEVSQVILQEISTFKKNIEINFDIDNSTLLVLDMQNYFFDSSSNAFVPSSTAIIPNVIKLVELFQSNGRPVVFTQHLNNKSNANMMNSWWKNLLKKKSGHYKIISELNKFQYKTIKKTQYDAFYKTNLNSFLKNHAIKQLVVCGVMTHLCCETTIRSAFVRGYLSFFPVDATATYNYEHHLSSFKNLSHGFSVPLLTKDILDYEIKA